MADYRDKLKHRIQQELISSGIFDDVLSQLRYQILQKVSFTKAKKSDLSLNDFAVVGLSYHYLCQLGVFDRSLSILLSEFRSKIAASNEVCLAGDIGIPPISACCEILKISSLQTDPNLLSSSSLKEGSLLCDLVRIAVSCLQLRNQSTRAISVQTDANSPSQDSSICENIEDQACVTIESHINRLQEQYKILIELEHSEQSKNVEKVMNEYRSGLQTQLKAQFDDDLKRFRDGEIIAMREQENKKYYTKLIEEKIRVKEDWNRITNESLREIKYKREELRKEQQKFDSYKNDLNNDLSYREKWLNLEEQRINIMLANAEMKANEVHVKSASVASTTAWESKQTKQSLEKVLETLNSQRQLLDEDIVKLNAERVEFKKQQTCINDVHHLRDEIESLHLELDRRNSETDQYRCQYGELCQQEQAAKDTNVSLRKTIQKQNELIIEKDRQINLAMAKIDSLNCASNELNIECEKLKRLLNKSQTALDAVKYSSTIHSEYNQYGNSESQAKHQQVRFPNRAKNEVLLQASPLDTRNQEEESNYSKFNIKEEQIFAPSQTKHPLCFDEENISSLTCDASQMSKRQLLDSLANLSQEWEHDKGNSVLVLSNHNGTGSNQKKYTDVSHDKCLHQINTEEYNPKEAPDVYDEFSNQDNDNGVIVGGESKIVASPNKKINKLDQINIKSTILERSIVNKEQTDRDELLSCEKIASPTGEKSSKKSNIDESKSSDPHLDYTHDFEIMSSSARKEDEDNNRVDYSEIECYDDDFDEVNSNQNDCEQSFQGDLIQSLVIKTSGASAKEENSCFSSSSVFLSTDDNSISKAGNELESYDTNFQRGDM